MEAARRRRRDGAERGREAHSKSTRSSAHSPQPLTWAVCARRLEQHALNSAGIHENRRKPDRRARYLMEWVAVGIVAGACGAGTADVACHADPELSAVTIQAAWRACLACERVELLRQQLHDPPAARCSRPPSSPLREEAARAPALGGPAAPRPHPPASPPSLRRRGPARRPAGSGRGRRHCKGRASGSPAPPRTQRHHPLPLELPQPPPPPGPLNPWRGAPGGPPPVRPAPRGAARPRPSAATPSPAPVPTGPRPQTRAPSLPRASGRGQCPLRRSVTAVCLCSHLKL